MSKLKLLVVAAALVATGIAPAVAMPTLSPGVAAREAQVTARLSPQALAWLKQEAGRARASNIVSEAAAQQAVRAAGPALDLKGVSVEDAMLVMMMNISRDAREDMRQMLADMEQTRLKKKAMRDAHERQAVAKASASSQFRQEYPAQQTHPSIPHSQALDDFLASQRTNYDALSEMSQEQQLKMQLALDRMTKAESAASNVAKKTSDAESAVIGNRK